MTPQEIAQYFADLPEERIDHSEGWYSENEPCCVGAHLANLLCEGKRNFYISGILAWAERVMKVSEHEARRLLVKAGAAPLPFGGRKWPTPVAEVFAKLAEPERAEEKPPEEPQKPPRGQLGLF